MNFLGQWLFGPFHVGWTALGLLVVRLVFGTGMALHGLQKMENPMAWMGPQASTSPLLQAAAGFSEFLGGLAWIPGLLTPVASLAVGATMTGAALLAHIPAGDPFVRQGAERAASPVGPLPAWLVVEGGQGGSLELAFLYLSVALLLMFAGPGSFSLDAVLFRRRRK